MAIQGKADQAYQAIEKMIVFQELEPGSLVSESMLTELTGFGRTPVREALQRLSRDRMVQIHPNQGVLIPATSAESQLRLLELRRVLEALAVQLACQRARPEHRAAMADLTQRLSTETFSLHEYADTVKATHGLIVAAANNDFLTDAMSPLQGLSRRFWFTHIADEAKEIAIGARLHLSLLSAILASDVDAAQAASRDLNDYLVQFAFASMGARPRVD